MNTPSQNYKEPNTKKEHEVRSNHPVRPYLGETKVEYPSGRSGSLHPGLVPGGDNRKFGVMGGTEQRAPTKQDQKTGKRQRLHRPREGNIGDIQESGRTKNRGSNRTGPKRLEFVYGL